VSPGINEIVVPDGSRLMLLSFGGLELANPMEDARRMPRQALASDTEGSAARRFDLSSIRSDLPWEKRSEGASRMP
jgi:hypothetical protein